MPTFHPPHDDPRRDFIGCQLCNDQAAHCDDRGLCPVCAENMDQEHGNPWADDPAPYLEED